MKSNISSAGAESRTLAAPGAANVGRMKVIEMTVDGGDVTLALTNVLGQEATTATFNDVADCLILYGLNATKWVLLKATATIA
jgi:hypothetical protein